MSRDPRSDELAASLAEVEARIAAACRSAGRDRCEVTLVAVTKTWPAEDVRRLGALGFTDVGENRDQEAAPKAAACADLGLRWHFVGRLQTNKARSVASYAADVHSVDREPLVAALGRAAVAAERPVGALVQVSLDADPGRGGVVPADVPRIAEAIARTDGLALRGIMAVAPLGVDPAAAFGRLAEVAGRLRADHPDAGMISAGMSGDLEVAVAAGATHVRIGTALLGSRPPLR
jgi:PLP dependent protein